MIRLTWTQLCRRWWLNADKYGRSIENVGKMENSSCCKRNKYTCVTGETNTRVTGETNTRVWLVKQIHACDWWNQYTCVTGETNTRVWLVKPIHVWLVKPIHVCDWWNQHTCVTGETNTRVWLVKPIHMHHWCRITAVAQQKTNVGKFQCRTQLKVSQSLRTMRWQNVAHSANVTMPRFIVLLSTCVPSSLGWALCFINVFLLFGLDRCNLFS